jgi:hypothetical protein
MTPSSSQVNEGASRSLEALAVYKATVSRLFPALSAEFVDYHSIWDRDALALTRLLELFPRGLVVLEVGTFIGVSTFHLAGHSNVSRVVSVDVNPSLPEIKETWERWAGEEPPGVRVQEVAEAALSHYPEERSKVELVAGTSESVEIPTPPANAPLIAFVDGDHAPEGVEADLRAIFGGGRHAVAVLHDCYGGAAPGVVAGLKSFVRTSEAPYRFRTFERLAPYQYQANLGVLYPESLAGEVERNASGLLADPTSEWLRQWVQAYKQQRRADRLQAKVERLQKQLDALKAEGRKTDRLWRGFFRRRFPRSHQD